ncbi:hypothetical protein RvY_11745 [Ramazzottius varieornatus]|uniref:Sulfatase N-terminal domain-containing protein n=1 Tax=Ramazzottius varieornatus TaxID=947166 RepID=A0A1D1VJI8_RAMVA|nr:hypothetical protein RvY_11745 [Ramazzottius varieornatus]
MKKVPPEAMNNHLLPNLITEKAEQIIKNFTPGNPFYLHVATPLVWKSYEYNKGVQFSMPNYQLKSPAHLLNDTFIERKRQMAAIQALDEQVGRIKRALDAKGISDNTIIAFMSDNGGADLSNPRLEQANHASNEPLRMGKGNLFEGGVRCVSFIWSGLFRRRGYVANRLFHVTDWLPTLWEAAGGQRALMRDDLAVDGVSHWKWLLEGRDKPGPREYLMNKIDSVGNMYAIIREEQDGTLYKMIGGELDTNVPGFRG